MTVNKKQGLNYRLKQWALLLFSVLLIIGFIFFLAPFLDNLPVVEPMVKYIENNDIEADALYYTDIEEFSSSETNIRNTMKYMPRSF